MLRTFAAMATSLALAAGCQTAAPKDDSAIVIEVGEDGQMRVLTADGSAEALALAQLLQSALDGEFDDAAEEPPEPLTEEEVWSKDAAGNLTHIQSGAQCPAQWGEYKRERVGIYQPDGTDVGCNYVAPDGKVQTIYVYLSDAPLAEELEATFEAMKTRQPVSEETPFAKGSPGNGYVARTLSYANADGTRMRTSVLLTNGGEWRLKIRLTCKDSDAPRAEIAAGLALIGQADRLASPRVPTTATPSEI